MNHIGVSQVALVVKNPPANVGDTRDVGSIPGLGRAPWRRAWQPTPVFLLGESHGQRGLVGYCLQAHKESETTEATTCMHRQRSQSQNALEESLREESVHAGLQALQGLFLAPQVSLLLLPESC